ncbi:MAG: hypothetical protein ACK5JT_24080, partial [Hyphomicrobiaceae bacterium]
HRLENTLGYNPVRLELYSRATGAEDHVGLPEQRKFSPLFPSYRSLLANMLGLRWIATPVNIEVIDPRLKTLPPDKSLAVVPNSGRPIIYENTETLPRVLFVTEARRADFETLLETGKWPDFDPHKTVLLQNPPAESRTGGTGQVRIAAYHQNRVDLEVSSNRGGWVLLNDIWHPWWFANIDGKSAPIRRANVLFRAVKIPPGAHRITMRFEPLAGLWRSLGSGHLATD